MFHAWENDSLPGKYDCQRCHDFFDANDWQIIFLSGCLNYLQKLFTNIGLNKKSLHDSMPDNKKCVACNKKQDLENNLNFDGSVCENCITESFRRYFRAKCIKCNGVILADELFISINLKCNDMKKPYIGYG